MNDGKSCGGGIFIRRFYRNRPTLRIIPVERQRVDSGAPLAFH